MSTFRKEPRYIVLKLKDLDAAGCTPEELAAFNVVCDKVTAARKARGVPPLFCCVVEADWRCYNRVWALVEEEHSQNERMRQCHTLGHVFDSAPGSEDGKTCVRCGQWVPE